MNRMAWEELKHVLQKRLDIEVAAGNKSGISNFTEVLQRMDDLERKYRPRRFKHYKGGIYEMLENARHTETGEEFVIYRGINDDPRQMAYARPAQMFFGDVVLPSETLSAIRHSEALPNPDEPIQVIPRFREIRGEDGGNG